MNVNGHSKLTIMTIVLCKVDFVGEQGADSGGLTREFFSLLARSVVPIYFDEKGVVVHNSIALQASINKVLMDMLK